MSNSEDLLVVENDDSSVLLAQYAERAYLDYAVSVVKGPWISPGGRLA